MEILPLEVPVVYDLVSLSDDSGSEVHWGGCERAQNKERGAKHAAYRAERGEAGDKSIAGRYTVDCAAITDGHESVAEMDISIKKTKLASIYAADFDFGRFHGVMMLSADEKALSFFSDNDDCCDDSDADERPQPAAPVTPARHPRGALGSGRPGNRPTRFFLCLRCREKEGGGMDPKPRKGSITFARDRLSFSGTMGIDWVGDDVPWSGRKISAKPEIYLRWEDYSYGACGWVGPKFST